MNAPTWKWKLVAAVLLLVQANRAAAQAPLHHLFSAQMPPGEIGRKQLELRPELAGYFQPVLVTVPQGALLSLADSGGFLTNDLDRALVGLQVGHVYRLRVSQIPNRGLASLYPTIELLDRLHPPIGKETRFPIPVDIAEEDIALALSGKYVTRVIYVEDPQTALPSRDFPDQRYFEVLPHEDPLEVAGQLGRPIAILRMGSVTPDTSGPDAAFLFASPPLRRFVAPQPVEYQPSELEIDAGASEPPLIPTLPAPAQPGPAGEDAADEIDTQPDPEAAEEPPTSAEEVAEEEAPAKTDDEVQPDTEPDVENPFGDLFDDDDAN